MTGFAHLYTGAALLLLSGLHTDKARYNPGAPVVVSATVTNTGPRPVLGGHVRLSAFFLNHAVPGAPEAVLPRLAPGASATVRLTWRPPHDDFRGYVLAVRAQDGAGNVSDAQTTAVDVSSHWAKFLRYGYVSECPPQSAAVSRDIIRQLSEFHLNAVMFYDWQYKHQKPLAGTVAHPAATWKNISNVIQSRQTVLDVIQAAHDCGMAAMNYNLLYGAWQGYGTDGVDYRWGLWKKPNATDQDQLPMPSGWATPTIYLFNPANPGWQQYLDTQEAKVFAAYPFDGWQVDQVGPPAGTDYDADGKPVDVWPTFRPFLNTAQAALHKALIFNNVGTYGLFDTAAHTDDAAVYVECWPFLGQTTYNDLQHVIDQSSDWSGSKAVTLAAYMGYKYANGFADSRPGAFNLPGVLLTDAVIFANGGDHIELGDGNQMLDSEYFPNHHLTPSRALLDNLHHYYDFMVGYENLLRGGLVADKGAVTLNVPSSLEAAPNTVWTFSKSQGDQHVIQFINLTGEPDIAWRDDHADKPTPTPQTNLVVTCPVSSGTVRAVSWATPDSPDITLHPLPFTTRADAHGPTIRFTLPRLAYWDMVYFTTSKGTAASKEKFAPAFTLADAAGHPRALREFRGRPITLFFFCGCPWCRECARTWGEFQRGGTLAGSAGRPPETVIVFGGTAGNAAAFEAQTGLVPGQTTMLLDPDLRVTLGVYHAEPCPRVFVLDAAQAVRYTNNHKNDEARSAPALAIDSRALSALRAAEASPSAGHTGR